MAIMAVLLWNTKSSGAPGRRPREETPGGDPEF